MAHLMAMVAAGCRDEAARHLGGFSQGISREPARPSHLAVGARVRTGAGTRAGRGAGAIRHSHAETQSDENITVAVAHAERAPNLLAYLGARGIDIEKVSLDETGARRAVVAQTHK